MSSEVLAGIERKMARAVEAMERDFQGIRTGRASTALVERIHVDYYGTQTPLNQLAGISVPEKWSFSSRSRRRCYSSRYFFLGGVAIFMSEGADSATFGFSFFGFLASRLLRT
jgi:hypothetical protein